MSKEIEYLDQLLNEKSAEPITQRFTKGYMSDVMLSAYAQGTVIRSDGECGRRDIAMGLLARAGFLSRNGNEFAITDHGRIIVEDICEGSRYFGVLIEKAA